jgi:LPXTG-site transpeptidase (sortase) family protein
MKFVRTALIILIVFIAAASFNKYQSFMIAQKQRQDLLNTFTIEIEGKCDLLKDDLRQFEGGGNINTPPTPSTSILELSSEEPEPEIENGSTDNFSNRLENYKVIGRIKIEKIDIDYPIIDITTSDSLNVSITWFCGSKINRPGNTVLAGHNRNNGSFFGKLNELDTGDIIELQDKSGNILKYEVGYTYIVKPDNLIPLDQDADYKKVLTLITCTNHGKDRFIVKAYCKE